MMSELTFEQLLRSNNIRVTPQRLAIIKIIHNAGAHLSPGDVYEIAKEKLPGINEATIYRTLDFFHKQGLLLCAHMGSSKFEYEIAEPHHHLVCLHCGKTIKIDHKRMVVYFQQIESETGFTIETRHLTLIGSCKKCKTNKEIRNVK